MKIRELNHVAVHVQDLDASCQFYREILGLEEIPRPAFPFPGTWFRYGTQQELHLIVDKEPESRDKGVGTHHALEVDSVETAQKELDTKGITYRGPFNRPDGARQIFLQDPDGHTIELTSNLPHI